MTIKRIAKTRRVLIYVRISLDREKQTSTGSQEKAARDYCSAMGWTVVEVVAEKGRSAFKDSRYNRPGLRKVMDAAAAGAADMVVVWKIDRIARNARDLLNIVEQLREDGAGFASVTESFDTTTPMGKAMLTIVAALAEMESAQKAERATSWHEHRRQAGMVPTGRTAWGYTRTRNTLTPDPAKAVLLQEAARRIVDGHTINSVLRWMVGEGAKVNRAGLLATLRSPTIAGLVTLTPRNGERFLLDAADLQPGTWEPIVDRATWDALQAILCDPSRRAAGWYGSHRVHPLRAIIRCECGAKMRVQPPSGNVRRGRYKCTGDGCGNGITQEPVDEAVFAAVLDRLDDKSWRSLRASGKPTGPDPAVIEAQLEQMWQLVLARKLDMDEYAEAKAAWKGTLVVGQQSAADLPDVESVREAWDGFTVDQRHVVLNRVITSLVVNRAVRKGPGTDLDRLALKLV